MRIVLSFATEIHWHEGHSMSRALVRLGHAVRVVNTYAPPFKGIGTGSQGYPADVRLTEILDGEIPDLFIYIEPRGLLPLGLEHAPCRTVGVLCDTALSLAPRQDLARLFDEVVLYHRDALDAFPLHGPDHVHWSPFALDPEIYRDRGGPRDFDVAYIGSLDGLWAERRVLVDRLARDWRMNDVERRYTNEDAGIVYSRARIVVNQCIKDTINPRVFEAMGAGALLLNGDTPAALERMFSPGVHFVTFKGIEDAVAKARYYLEHEAERASIATAGCAAVHDHHTWDTRLMTLLGELGAGPGFAPARRMAADEVDDIYQRRHKQAGQVEALLRRAAECHPWSRRRAVTLWRAATTAARRGWWGG